MEGSLQKMRETWHLVLEMADRTAEEVAEATGLAVETVEQIRATLAYQSVAGLES